jgi:hypothetical protein
MGSGTKTEQAACMWCALNRVDAGYGDLSAVVTHSSFYGYKASNPIRQDLLDLAYDVLCRWYAEKDGVTNSGRVLAKGYCWFYGDGKHNYFRNGYKSPYDTWKWTLDNPYGETVSITIK